MFCSMFSTQRYNYFQTDKVYNMEVNMKQGKVLYCSKFDSVKLLLMVSKIYKMTSIEECTGTQQQ